LAGGDGKKLDGKLLCDKHLNYSMPRLEVCSSNAAGWMRNRARQCIRRR